MSSPQTSSSQHIYFQCEKSGVWGRCGEGGDLRDFQNQWNSTLFRIPQIWACASLVGDSTTITRGGHTTSTHPKPNEFIGFWALAGRRGLSGKAAGSRKSPSPWDPTPCSAARGPRYMPGNPGARRVVSLRSYIRPESRQGNQESHKGHEL